MTKTNISCRSSCYAVVQVLERILQRVSMHKVRLILSLNYPSLSKKQMKQDIGLHYYKKLIISQRENVSLS